MSIYRERDYGFPASELNFCVYDSDIKILCQSQRTWLYQTRH